MWKFVSVFAILFVTCSTLPLAPDTDATSTQKNDDFPTLATELLPPRKDAEDANFAGDLVGEHSSPSVELLPPKDDTKDTVNKGAVFLINLFAIKNQTGENISEILNDEVIKNNPEILEPVAIVLLILEEDDEDKPVSLDELAKDLEEEGLKVEKVVDSGDTKVIKVDFDDSIETPDVELIKEKKLNSLRKKRSPHGLISKLLNKGGGGGGGYGGYGGGYGGGCQGGCGGGGYSGGGTVGVIPVIVVPVQGGGGRQHSSPPQYHQPQYQQPQYQQPQYHQPQYQPQPQYSQPHGHPSGGQCNTCGGNHGSYSQSSAQASAQSSSGNW